MDRHRAGFATLFRKETFDSEEAYMENVKSFSSFFLLDGKKTYPPTFFLHGTKDTAVPVTQSYRMAEKLKGMGVPTGEAYCEGGEHSFEQKIEVSGLADYRPS